MNDIELDGNLRRIVAEMSGLSPVDIDFAKWVTDHGVDSLQLLIFREACERVFQTYLPDVVWSEFRSLTQLRSYLASRQEAPKAETAPSRPGRGLGTATERPSRRVMGHFAPGDLSEPLEIGMPVMGIANLSEGPLLQRVGELRWAHVSAFTGAPSKAVVDEEGNRLYATFFYVEIAFPESRPMASYGENDRVLMLSHMARFGGSFLDGVTYLLPDDGEPGTVDVPAGGAAQAAAAGVPAIRLSNIFVSQFGGAEWLKKSRPANPGFDRIPELALGPDSYSMAKQAEKEGQFRLPDATYLDMTDGAVETEYRLFPDRDVNGAGLIYFANYPVFLDIAEREVLAGAKYRVSHELLNRRTLVRRQSAYLNNASWKDVLTIETRCWIQNPFLAGNPAPELAPVRLFTCQRMRRNSDGRTMVVSTSEKILFGCSMEELSFFPDLGGARP